MSPRLFWTLYLGGLAAGCYLAGWYVGPFLGVLLWSWL